MRIVKEYGGWRREGGGSKISYFVFDDLEDGGIFNWNKEVRKMIWSEVKVWNLL